MAAARLPRQPISRRSNRPARQSDARSEGRRAAAMLRYLRHGGRATPGVEGHGGSAAPRRYRERTAPDGGNAACLHADERADRVPRGPKIDVRIPQAARLAASPARFSWASVANRGGGLFAQARLLPIAISLR